MAAEPQTSEAVTQESAPASEAVKEQAETTAQEFTATSETNEQPQVESQETTQTVSTPINPDLYDERGVPWKNVAMEHRRKYEETQANLPKLVAEEIAKTTQQQSEKKYTIAELEQFAQANPEHRAWVEEEKAKVVENRIAEQFNQRMEATNKAQNEAIRRRESFQQVITNYPNLVIKDQSGKFVGWNNLDPMTPIFASYMARPEFQVPGGDVIAAKCAFADLQQQRSPQTQKTISALKSQVKKAQAATFVEGGGKKVVDNTSPMKKHLDKVSQSGRAEDAAGVFREIHKQMGMTKE
jgi:hypothetical protein